MQTQPRFAVVTFVLVCLVAFAFISKLLDPYIVEPSNRRLINATSPFLQSAVHQHIAWFPLSERAFQDAHRLDRPILLMVGAPWSIDARKLDANVFSSVAVQKLLAHEFICIRADAVETPDWMTAYLPFSRADLGLDPGVQLWMLDSTGRMFRLIAYRDGQQLPNDTQFTDELATDLADLQQIRDAEFDLKLPAGEPGAAQNAELARLSSPPQRLLPDLDTYRDRLAATAQAPASGGFPVGRRQRLWPQAWTFLLEASGPAAAQASLDGLLKSPCLDLLDGGFYLSSLDPGWRTPAYDKVAVLNAEMCALLAKLDASDPSGPYGRFSRSTFDSLAGEFLDSEGLIMPCRIGDEQGHFGRSVHASFNPRQIRIALTVQDRQWAYQYLNLRPTVDAAVTPFVTDFAVLDAEPYERVMKSLRATGPMPPFDHEVTLATFGPAAARLVEAARTLGDPVRLARAQDIVARVELFRRGADVVHELSPSERGQPTLSDYVGYADAALEDFLSSGHVAALQNGAAVLRRGLALFATVGQGAFRTGRDVPFHRLAADSNSPQICDDSGESANAKAIRLAWSYSVLFAGSAARADVALADELKSRATACITQFADSATDLGQFAAGYAIASALTIDNTFVLCAGLDPEKMANAFARRCPFRMVSPVAGPVYPGLFRKPGYYVIRRGRLLGPFSADVAAGMLPSTLYVSG